jgi:formylglycine-generating enzyme required for sulfatase activity
MSARPAPEPEATASVFISYASDDPQWPAGSVESLAVQFADAGARVYLDRWAVRDRRRKLSDDEWRAWMQQGLADASHVVCLGSTRYTALCDASSPAEVAGRGVAFERVEIEQLLYDSKQHNAGRVMLCLPAGAEAPRRLRGRCPQYRAPQELGELVDHLCRPSRSTRFDTLRRRLRALLDEELVDLYVTLAGKREQERVLSVRLPQSAQRRIDSDSRTLREHLSSEHADLLEVIAPQTRAVLLGEPGAGKTFAMLKLIESDLTAGRLPVWVKLNHWLDGAMAFETFVAGEVPDLDADWPQAIATGRGRLLLDGLNELPVEHATTQVQAIADWLQGHADCSVLISCREHELPAQAFAFLRERLTLKPLRAEQIRCFVHNYIVQGQVDNEAAADALFWQLMGGVPFKRAWNDRPASAPESDLNDLVDAMRSLDWLAPDARQSLADERQDPAWSYPMVTNPYLLTTLLWVWSEDESLRSRAGEMRRRVDVFSRYAGERLRAEIEKTHSPLNAQAIQDTLATLAARLQHLAERSKDAREAGVLALAWDEIEAEQRPALLIALGARLLRLEGPLIRFRHQLLHEFYVAHFLHHRLGEGSSQLLGNVWGRHTPLWQRSGWIQPFLLLAEYQHTDVVALIRTLADIQPEVAGAVWAQARRLQPALLTEALADDITATLAQRMLPAQKSANFPKDEAAFGCGLGLMQRVNGRPLDTRPGVWGWYDATRGRAEVDIDWVRIPAGPFIYQGKPATIEQDFLISRYPVTHSQFQAFVDDPGGWADPRWWGKVPASERRQVYAPAFRYSNHPCTDVSWWAAQAYCRWLAALRQAPIGLPSERQWERAAAGTQGADYPWAGPWSPSNANTERQIGKTSFCGLFDGGASPEGVHDLAGNVWEWTADRYGRTDWGPWWQQWLDAAMSMLRVPGARRAVRGGSWGDRSGGCRAACRSGLTPEGRDSSLGFRVVCCPIQDP